MFRTLLAGLFLLSMTGCFTRKDKSVKRAPIATPRPVHVPAKSEDRPLPPPPKVEASKQPAAELPPEVQPHPAPAPPKAAVVKPPRRPPKPAKQAPAVATAPPPAPPVETPPAPAPQLTTLISPREEKRMLERIDASVRSAESNLARLTGRTLAGDQAQNYERARSFLRQARDKRGSDLTTALALAQRADALARDLASATP